MLTTTYKREATRRERALNAEDALKAAHTEIAAQGTRIGELRSELRDLEAVRTEEPVRRSTSENPTPKEEAAQ